MLRLLLTQLLLVAGLGAGLFFLAPERSGSVVIGGLLCVVPNSYFMLQALRHFGTQRVVDATLGFFKGQMGKMVLTALGFALAFRFYDALHAPTAFGSFILMMFVQLFMVRQFSDRLTASEQDRSKNH